jgi:hypothetical protein
MNVELDHLGARTRSAVAYLEADPDWRARRHFIRRNLEIAVVELGIRKTVAEGEKRIDLLLIEISVADVNSLRVLDLQILARIMSVRRRILPLFHKRDRQLSRWICVAK